ncbi:MAG: hypothetical protein HUU41_04245 [Bryobacteraceae bacterium]|nr:hypothetical protein [Bryobacterales bacterium]MEB2362391.1 hypothetical protein [Bryobacterales bacterium]NUN00300.1 hypothetical protein [Bryobacteraceae bacterium]
MDSDRGCCAQVRTRVPAGGLWLHDFSAGLHHAIFYGDYVKTVERLGRLMSFEVVREA